MSKFLMLIGMCIGLSNCILFDKSLFAPRTGKERIEGKVERGDGRPVGNLELILVGWPKHDYMTTFNTLSRTTTKSDGSFSFENLPLYEDYLITLYEEDLGIGSGLKKGILWGNQILQTEMHKSAEVLFFETSNEMTDYQSRHGYFLTEEDEEELKRAGILTPIKSVDDQ